MTDSAIKPTSQRQKRQQGLSAALRANLMRRKAAAKSQEDGELDDDQTPADKKNNTP